jgi:hypothetical protein
MNARALAVLALGLSLAAPAAAQRSLRPQPARVTVRGTVVDATSGTPLPNTMIRLVEANRGVLADSLGRFSFPDVAPGTQTLAVKQYGYEEIDTDIEVSAELRPLQVQLQPGPVALEGFDVVADRLAVMKQEMKQRRDAAPVTVRTVGQEMLAQSTARDMLEFLELDGGMEIRKCSGFAGEPGPADSFQSARLSGRSSAVGSSSGDLCVFTRGALRTPSVYIDESPTIGGLDELATYRPYELYTVELFGGNRPEVHVYTHNFVEMMARHPVGLMPFIL